MRVFCALSAVLLATAWVVPAHAADEFDLTIDGQKLDITAGEEQSITLKDGRVITLRLDRKQVITFEQPTFSFRHPGAYAVTSKEIEPGIVQSLLVTATGTMVLVQTYDDIDPSNLVKLMTREITDEDVAAGAQIETKPHNVKLENGAELQGERSQLKANRDDVTVDVVARPVKKGGVLVVTRHDTYTSPEDKALLDQFWSSLAVKE
jgi:hypothetical protein